MSSKNSQEKAAILFEAFTNSWTVRNRENQLRKLQRKKLTLTETL